MYSLTWKKSYKSINILLYTNHNIYLLPGAGDFYCSGNDLGNFMNIPPDGIKAMAEKGGEILE